MRRLPFVPLSMPLLRLIALLSVLVFLGGCARSTNFNRWDARTSDAAGTTSVRPGDTLYSIAVAHDLDWRDVARWNGIGDPRSLRVGQTLRLTAPATGHRPVVAHHRAGSASTASSQRHAETPPTVTGNGAVHWLWPAQGKVESRFIDGSNLQKGLIIAGALGEPVHASTSGEVVYAGNGLPGYGNLLIIKYDGTWLSAYGYNQKLLVKEGDRVKAGQRVALMGRRDGRALDKTGSLLFQIRRDGKPVDPLRYLPKR
ncbi:MAG TPA: peptidoglycan DD-metalloendopeptidase family protein [Halothiobacillus sp.]|nr:peptidoglycan DD-metalloendopeptidase family protein [Halothiobacillus sp.]